MSELASLVKSAFQEYSELAFDIYGSLYPKLAKREVGKNNHMRFVNASNSLPEEVSFLNFHDEFSQAAKFMGEFQNDVSSLEETVTIKEDIAEGKGLEKRWKFADEIWVNPKRIIRGIFGLLGIPIALYYQNELGPEFSVPMAGASVSFILDAILRRDNKPNLFSWAGYTFSAMPIVSALMNRGTLENTEFNDVLNINTAYLLNNHLFSTYSHYVYKYSALNPAKIQQARRLEHALNGYGRLKSLSTRIGYTLAVASFVQDIQNNDGVNKIANFPARVSKLENLCCEYMRNEIGTSKIKREMLLLSGEFGSNARKGVQKSKQQELPSVNDVFEYAISRGISEDSTREISRYVSYEQAKSMYERLHKIFGNAVNVIIEQNPLVLAIAGRQRKDYIGSINYVKRTFNGNNNDFADYVKSNLAYFGSIGGLKSLVHAQKKSEKHDNYDETEPKKTFIQARKVIHSRQYKKDLENNPVLHERILETESAIESLQDFNPFCHKGFFLGSKGWRHARVGMNFRIIYSYNPNGELRYERLLSHNEMDRLVRNLA